MRSPARGVYANLIDRLRERPVTKRSLDRHWVTVRVGAEPVRVKVAFMAGVIVNEQPGYEDLVDAASRSGRPIKTVLAEAIGVAHPAG